MEHTQNKPREAAEVFDEVIQEVEAHCLVNGKMHVLNKLQALKSYTNDLKQFIEGKKTVADLQAELKTK